jgi:hypothetical protein
MALPEVPVLPMLCILPADLPEEEVWQLAYDGYEKCEQPVPVSMTVTQENQHPSKQSGNNELKLRFIWAAHLWRAMAQHSIAILNTMMLRPLMLGNENQQIPAQDLPRMAASLSLPLTVPEEPQCPQTGGTSQRTVTEGRSHRPAGTATIQLERNRNIHTQTARMSSIQKDG